MKNKIILEEYLTFKRQTCQQSTIRDMRSILKKYFKYLPEDDSLEVSTKERMIYLDKMAQSLAPPTFAHVVHQVKDFYSYCELYGFVSGNPFERFHPKVTYKPSFDILFEPELMEFFDLIDYDKRLSFPERFLLELFIATMGQVKEVLHLKVHRVLFKDGQLFFHVYGDQYLMSNSWIQEHWEDYLNYREHRMFEGNESHSYLLVNDVGKPMTTYGVSKVFNEVGERYNIQINPSKLRRSLIAYLVDDGIDYRDLQVLVGHKYVRSSVLYKRFRIKDKRETIERYLERGKAEDDSSVRRRND